MSETNVAGAFLQGNQVWIKMWDGECFMFRECEYLAKADYLRNYLCDEFSLGARVILCDHGNGNILPILDGRTVTDFWS